MKQFTKISFLALILLLSQALEAQVTRPNDPRDIKDVRFDKTRSGMTKSSSDPQNANQTFSKELTKDEEITPDQSELIKKYAASITAEDLEALLSFIASDELEGRETGTRGQKVAARYLASQFQKIGLKPGNK